ncbi:MAG: hypothetical protein ACYDAZ_04325 [Thermoplasmataceae archaeon]
MKKITVVKYLLIRDIEKKLDMRGIVSVEQEGPLFEALKDSEISVPAFIFEQDEKRYLQAYFPDGNSKYKKLLSDLSYQERHGFLAVQQRINNVRQMDLATEIFETPSMVMNNIYIFNGRVYFDFRFHRNYVEKVSDTLSSFMENYESTRLWYMGPTRGVSETIEKVNEIMPLSVIRYRVPSDPLSDVNYSMIVRYGLIGEIENKKVVNGGFQTLIYSTRGLSIDESKGLSKISEEDQVYGTVLFNRFLLEIRKKANSLFIPRVAYFVRALGNKIEVTTFLPSSAAEEYVRMLFAMARDTETKGVSVTSYYQYDSSLWNTL